MKNFLTIFLLWSLILSPLTAQVTHKFPNKIRYRRVAKKPFNSYDKYYPGLKKVYVRQYPLIGQSQQYRQFIGPRTSGVIYYNARYSILLR